MDVREVLERLGASAVASHETAARAWGLSLLSSGPDRVTVPRNRAGLSVPGWRVHRADLGTGDRAVRGGVAVTGVVRTVVDLARTLPPAQAVVVADSAVRLGLVRLDVLVAALRSPTGRGAAGPRRVAQLVRADSHSALESLLFVLLMDRGIPRPRSQLFVGDDVGRISAQVDFAWPWARLVVETDGFAFHSDRAAYRRDRERSNELARLGWRMLRFTWEDVQGRPEHVVELVLECLRQGFGVRPPRLAWAASR